MLLLYGLFFGVFLGLALGAMFDVFGGCVPACCSANGKVGDEVARYLSEMLVVRFFEALVDRMGIARERARELDNMVCASRQNSEGNAIGGHNFDRANSVAVISAVDRRRSSNALVHSAVSLHSHAVHPTHSIRLSRKLSSDFVAGLSTPRGALRAGHSHHA